MQCLGPLLIRAVLATLPTDVPGMGLSQPNCQVCYCPAEDCVEYTLQRPQLGGLTKTQQVRASCWSHHVYVETRAVRASSIHRTGLERDVSRSDDGMA